MKLGKEQWRPVVGAETRYEVSNYGQVRNTKTGRKLKIGQCNAYCFVWISYTPGKYRWRGVHCLVAEAFIGPCPEGHEVNHRDFIRSNNWCGNLEYLTHKKNREYSRRAGRCRKKLTEQKVLKIRELFATGQYSQRELARRFGVTEQPIGFIVNRKTWTHI